ncbi:hypothetical protein ACHAWF_010771 [Thalassiosira exigua]
MDFTRKAGFVANRSTTDTPVGLCYSSAVSRDSVRIALLVAALNELGFFVCDIGNTYLNVPCREIIWFVAGKECSDSMKGKDMKLVCVLYGLKSPRSSWRKMFKDYTKTTMGLKPSKVDGDLYYRKNANEDRTLCYELLLVYVVDVLVVVEMIGALFDIKKDDYEPPKMYLGGSIEKFQLPDGKMTWSLISTSYVRSAVETVRGLLAEEGRDLKTGKKSQRGPLPYGYKPESTLQMSVMQSTWHDTNN